MADTSVITSFIGRERELGEVHRLLHRSRLLTIIGAGGSGKSRLAYRVADEVGADYRHGVARVELAALRSAADIPNAVARALGLSEATGTDSAEVVAAALRETSTLLLLDNCELLAAECAALALRLLTVAYGLRILATSRQPLGVDGEVTYPLPPLSLPPEGASMEQVLTAEAPRLFVERAAAARPDFVIDDGCATAIGRLCRGLDGLPLAIELAASRVRSLSPAELVDHLDDRFVLLGQSRRGVPRRQQTLRATVDWSHDLLEDEERVLLRRLAAFSATWRLVDAEAVCPGDHLDAARVLGAHSRLVDCSLVSVANVEKGVTRFRMLETIRQYAHERLVAAGEDEAVRRRLCSHLLDIAVKYHLRRMGGGSDEELPLLVSFADDLRATLDWAAGADPDSAFRLTAVLDDFWRMTGPADGWARLRELLASVPTDHPDRLFALLTAGMLAAYVPEYDAGSALLDEAAALARRGGDAVAEAWARLWRGRLAFFSGDLTRAEEDLATALRAHEQQGNALGLVRALCLLGLLQALVHRDHRRGEANLERAAALAREHADGWGEGYAEMMLCLCAGDTGEAGRAATHGRRALQVPALGPLLGVSLQGLAQAAVAREPVRAMRLLGAAAGHFQRHATVEPAFLGARSEATRAHGVQLLGAERVAREWEAGLALTTAEAIEYASLSPAHHSIGRGGLTPREEQVALLVARGRTNSEIATALQTTVRTAESHISHILTKLDLRNRTELGAWVTSHQTPTGR